MNMMVIYTILCCLHLLVLADCASRHAWCLLLFKKTIFVVHAPWRGGCRCGDVVGSRAMSVHDRGTASAWPPATTPLRSPQPDSVRPALDIKVSAFTFHEYFLSFLVNESRETSKYVTILLCFVTYYDWSATVFVSERIYYWRKLLRFPAKRSSSFTYEQHLVRWN